MKRLLGLFFGIMAIWFVGSAQIHNPVTWDFQSKKIGENEFELTFNANIQQGWHLYSSTLPDGGPIPTSFNFEDNAAVSFVGKIKELSTAHEEFDKNFDMNLKYFGGKAVFKQVVKISGSTKLVGMVEYMSCNDETCTPPTEADFEFDLKGKGDATAAVKEKPERIKKDVKKNPDNLISEDSSLWYIFFVAFLSGLVALLTPCVFPMIPMTVSFFMKEGEDKKKGKFQAMFFGLSIIGIYTIIGTLVAVTLGANFANFLSTHWIPNILFFIIFVVFAASFFGMFEITLPNWMVSKSDAGADKGGLAGSFFMALTLVLVSFSCTGPIVGAILVMSAGGEVLLPIVGMFGFSLAFALPFTLFALFPSWLSNMPKSGGWLNSVKVVLGFVELALGLKFLSVADQTYHWGLLDREIYLALWIVIFTLMGFYLLGKLKFSHDSEVKHVSVPRLMLAIASFSFVVYMVPGMFGAPLKALSGYTPPAATHDFDIPTIIRENAGSGTGTHDYFYGLCDKPKHSDFLHLPHGLKGYFDYEQGMACAKKQNKPVFIDFTGHGCVNCREMEANVWSDPRVLKRLKEDYIIIALYVDDKTKLPESEWVVSTYDNKTKKTVGKKYADFQISKFNVNAQPYYTLLGHEGGLLNKPRAYDLDVDAFIEFLDKGVEEFKKKNK